MLSHIQLCTQRIARVVVIFRLVGGSVPRRDNIYLPWHPCSKEQHLLLQIVEDLDLGNLPVRSHMSMSRRCPVQVLQAQLRSMFLRQTALLSMRIQLAHVSSELCQTGQTSSCAENCDMPFPCLPKVYSVQRTHLLGTYHRSSAAGLDQQMQSGRGRSC